MHKFEKLHESPHCAGPKGASTPMLAEVTA